MAGTAYAPLAGRVALVTGASRTLGRVIARELAARGADVAVNYYRSKREADELAVELRSMGVRSAAVLGDMASSGGPREAAAAAVEALGNMDILVHNAGPYDDRPFLDLPEEKWREVFEANCTALYLLSKELAPTMRRQGWGRIVAIGASSARIRSQSVYGLAKDALIHLVEALAFELAPEITVNAVSPGLIADNEDMTPEFTSQSVADTPLKRLVTRREVSEVVAMLCASPFDSVTGHNLLMDGGRTIPRRG